MVLQCTLSAIVAQFCLAAENCSGTTSNVCSKMVIPTRCDIPCDLPPAIRRLAEKTFSADPVERAEAAIDLGKMGERAAPVIPFLIRLLSDKWELGQPGKHNPGLCAQIALRDIGKPAVVPLIATLQHADRDRRIWAAYVLADLGDRRAFEPLVALLNDNNQRLRRVAVTALEELGDPRAAEPLIGVMNNKAETEDIRVWAIMSLGHIPSRSSIDPLVAVLKDEKQSSRLRAAAAEALGYKKDRRAVESLLAMTTHRDRIIRQSVFWGLARAGHVSALETLLARLKDRREDERIRGAAAIGLGRTRDRRAVEYLLAATDNESEPLHVQMSLVMALALTGDPRATERVFATLKDARKEMRYIAALALPKISDTKIVEPLIKALKHKDGIVRQMAAKALGQLKDARALELLTALSDDASESVRFAAKKARLTIRGTITPLDEWDLSSVGDSEISGVYLDILRP